MRHGKHIYRCAVRWDGEREGEEQDATMTVRLDGDDQGIAAGQYAVFYDDCGVCLGGGVIQCALPGSPKHPVVELS
jgi:tRNA U34 2-thiouridine synthase MnmA/TrmU